MRAAPIHANPPHALSPPGTHLMEKRASDAPNQLAHPLTVASIVATAFFMESVDLTVIVTVLPRMAEAFGVTPVALSLGLTSYILALAVTLPASGWIADRFGPRNVFMAAIAGFTVASMLCGQSGSLPEFVVWRSLQGVAGALMSPVGRLVLLRSTDKKDLVRAMNFVTAPGLVGPIVGPPIGGFIATYADWRWIFYLNLPVGLIGLALVWFFIPKLRGGERRPFDLTGFVLNGIGLGCLLFGVDLVGHTGGWRATGAVIAAFGLGAGWLAVRHYRKSPAPLVDLSALNIRTFRLATLQGGSLFRLSMAAPIFVLPLFLQVGLGHTAFATGMIILAHTGGDLAAKTITTRTLRWLGFKKLMIYSAVAFGIMMAMMGYVSVDTPYWALLLLLVVSGAVRSLQMTALGAPQFADVPREQMTGAATYAGVNQHVTRAIGIAIAALVLNALPGLRGLEGGPFLFDFRMTFILSAFLSIAASVRYLSLADDAGAQVSAGRQG